MLVIAIRMFLRLSYRHFSEQSSRGESSVCVAQPYADPDNEGTAQVVLLFGCDWRMENSIPIEKEEELSVRRLLISCGAAVLLTTSEVVPGSFRAQ